MDINPFEILKNAQKVQEKMGEFQAKLGLLKAAGFSGGGMVEIEMNGNMEVQGVRIAPEAIAEGDREMLQDLVAAAFNSALENIKEEINREIGAMAGLPGGIPGMPGIFS
ncbi:MAG: YbaB/EbfC family nucleoid-associated protein [Treponema sp.]|jgi:DNA-binding YbaB/EbfC family protein|nr:YbaB/EbfC family nucleoid-associated protein [Treponema sp.]